MTKENPITDPGPRKHTAVPALAHVLVIAMLFVLPEAVMAFAMPHRHTWLAHPGFYVNLGGILTVFYLNYFLLVRRFLGGDRSRIWQFVAVNLVLVAAVTLLCRWGADLVGGPHRGRGGRHLHDLEPWRLQLRSISFILRDAGMLLLAVGTATALRLSAMWNEARQRRRDLEATQKESELAALRAQINPHFLFNSLNTIYALTDADPEKAKNAILLLSDLMRHGLYDEAPAVALPKEEKFVADYIALMNLRINPSRNRVEYRADIGADPSFRLAPLLLIPLVENAFKYGLQYPGESTIAISLTLGGDTLRFDTSNRFAPTAPARGSHGIGLQNLRRRLSLIYGSKATLRTSTDGDTFRTSLTLPNLPDNEQ